MASGWITIKTELDTKQFDAQITDLENKLEDLEAQRLYFSDNQMTGELQDVEVEIEKTTNKLIRLKQQKDKATAPGSIEGMNKAFKSVGSSIQGAIGKVSRLILGVFALRSAYMAVRRASSELATYDQQYATNLEYIRFALTQMIAPVLRWIVQMASTLLQYINMIVNALFGVNLFSQGSAENFKKMKSSAGGVSKAVKEIKKQLLGFDEINMLTDQSDTGTSAGAGGVGTPDFDLSAIQVERPKWLDWLVSHKDELLALLSGIAGFLIAIKLGLGGIKALGIGAVIGGIVYAIEGLIKYLQDPSFINFGQIIEGIGIALIGLAVIIASLPVAIAGAVTLIVGIIIKYWEQIKSFLQGGIDWLIGQTDWVKEQFGIVGEFIYNIFINCLQRLLDWFDLFFTTIKKTFDGFIIFIKGVFTGNWKQAWEGIRQIVIAVIDYVKNSFLIFVNFINNSIVKPIINTLAFLWNTFLQGGKKALDGIMKIFDVVPKYFGDTFWRAWDKVKNVFSTGGKIFDGIKEGIVNAFTKIVNAIISGINRVVAIPFNKINDVLNKIKGVDILGVKPFDWAWGWNPISVPQIPYLKTGGIINMPNRGTMIGGMAIGGEAGREGVIPLTDQQAMAELGREIGRNVLINLTNVTTMNGRILSREMKNIQSEEDFAYNV